MDNEAVTDEEMDIISMFAAKGEDDTDDVDAVEEIPETVEELKAALIRERDIKSKRNKSLRKSKDANHRLQDELKDLKSEFEQLRSSITAPTNEAQKREREEALAQWRESVADKPETALDYMDLQMSQLKEGMINWMSDFKSEVLGEVNSIKGATNPELMKYENELNILRQNEDFADLDNDTLLKFVKATKAASERAPRGGLGGRRATAQPEELKVTDDHLRAMGFNV